MIEDIKIISSRITNLAREQAVSKILSEIGI